MEVTLRFSENGRRRADSGMLGRLLPFVSLEELLKEQRVGFMRIDGSTPSADRHAFVQQFQTNDKIRVALLRCALQRTWQQRVGRRCRCRRPAASASRSTERPRARVERCGDAA